MLTRTPIAQKCSLLILTFLFLFLPKALAVEDESAEEVSDIQSSSATDAAVGTLGSQALLESKAVRFFILRDYEKSLAEFRLLAEQYPEDLVIERYVGACLSALRRDDEAFMTFEEILKKSPEDLPSYKFLAKMRLRRGETQRAKEMLEKLVALDTTGTFSSYAAFHLKELKTIEEAKASDKASLGRQIDPEEFLKTKAAIAFMDAEYQKAYDEFVLLEAQYPDDVTVKRYAGMCLDKLGRYEEAIALYNRALLIAPDNAALKYALAQTHFHNKDLKASTDLLKNLSTNDLGDYKMKADRDLEAIDRIEAAIRSSEGKPLTISVDQGFEINTNAASEPQKLQVPAEEHAVRFPGSVSANYRLVKNGPWTLSGNYAYFQAFYSDSLDYLNTIVNSPGFSLSYLGSVGGKPVFLIYSTSYVHVSVEDEFYYQSYPQTIRAITSFWDWHRIILSEKVSWTDYKDTGSDPKNTSRGGFSNTLGVTNNFYFNKERSLYLAAGYEYKMDDVEGSRYVRDVHQFSLELNFPWLYDWTGTVYTRYKNSDYPETNAAIQRLDREYTSGVSFSFPLNQTLKLKLFYDYTNNDSKDPIYDYVNNAGGSSLSCVF